MENRPAAHGARVRWRTWRGCFRGQRGAHSTPRRWMRLFFTDTVAGRRQRLQTSVIEPFESRGARPTRTSPRGNPAVRPRSTRALADLAWLFRGQCGACSTSRRWTRLFFTDTAPGRRRVAMNPRDVSFRTPIRAARTRFAPWITGRPPTDHACAGRPGVVVFAANARRAPSHAIGRVSSSLTSCQVSGRGFETS